MKILSGNRRVQTVLVIVLLLAILAGAVFVGHYGWVSAGDVTMPAWGWLMMGLGIFFTLLVGGGLMALVFYSGRAGFDEPPEVVQEQKHRPKHKKAALVLGRAPKLFTIIRPCGGGCARCSEGVLKGSTNRATIRAHNERAAAYLFRCTG
jgi:hypothetical protein